MKNWSISWHSNAVFQSSTSCKEWQLNVNTFTVTSMLILSPYPFEFFIMISWNRFYHFPKIISIFQSSNVRFFFEIWKTIIIFERAKINIKINLKILDLNARKQVRKSKYFQDGMSCMYVCCFTSNSEYFPNLKTICFCNVLKLFKTKFIQRTNQITLHIILCMKDEYYNSTSRLQFSRSEHESFQ